MRLKNIVPKNLINTRWYSFADALDQYLKQFKNDKINLLKNKFIPDLSEKANLRDLVQRKGFNLIEADGYASTVEYFRRRATSISTEVAWLLSDKCYRYLLKSFWLTGKSYALFIDKNDQFYYPQIQVTDINSDTSNVTYQVIDQESDIIYYFIEGVPVPNPPIPTNLPLLTLDSDIFLTLDYDENRFGTNHFLIEFGFNLVEDKNVFISYNTSKALYETVSQIHRLKEIPHYRSSLSITVNTNRSVYKKEYSSFDNDPEKTSYVESIYINNNFDLAKYIQLGSSSYPVLSDNDVITSVSVPICTIAISGWFDIMTQSASGLEIQYKIEEFGKLKVGASGGDAIYSYSEVLVLDSEQNPIVYSKFPRVNFYEQMYSGVKFNFICQDI